MRFISSIVFCALFVTAPTAFSFSNLQNSLPNGDRFRCGTCHISSQGGEGWNVFGLEMLRQGGANPAQNPNNQNAGWSGPIRWQNLCALDSDGDTFSNGQELGDPDCTWSIGDAFPIVPNITAPHDADSFPTPCPNGVREGDEECDFEDLDNQTCQDLGFSGGALFCTFECTFSTNRCFTCGDGIIEIGEVCDDGNNDEGDGCTDCVVDEDYECDFEPSICNSTLPDAGLPDVIANPDVVEARDVSVADVQGGEDAITPDVLNIDDVLVPDVTRVDVQQNADVQATQDANNTDAGVQIDAGPNDDDESCSCYSAPKKAPLAGAFFLALVGLVFRRRG